jgi:hypothetical protein
MFYTCPISSGLNVHSIPTNQEPQLAYTEPYNCGLIALKLIAGCTRLLAFPGKLNMWDFVFGDVALKGRFFTLNIPAAFG